MTTRYDSNKGGKTMELDIRHARRIRECRLLALDFKDLLSVSQAN